jgi:hypothetical protein
MPNRDGPGARADAHGAGIRYAGQQSLPSNFACRVFIWVACQMPDHDREVRRAG